MPRIARVVAVGEPHHIVQRGNRCQKVFFHDSDKEKYLSILHLQARLFELDVWAYCLMDNHVHIIAVPKKEDSLVRAIGETHRLYTRMINFRKQWRGYLWQGRFKSMPLDESYLYAAIRYVERNPVRAKIVSRAEDYRWSSARSHVHKIEDKVLSPFPLLNEIENWSQYLTAEEKKERLRVIRHHSTTGRPLGSEKFIQKLENQVRRVLRKEKPGPKKK